MYAIRSYYAGNVHGAITLGLVDVSLFAAMLGQHAAANAQIELAAREAELLVREFPA